MNPRTNMIKHDETRKLDYTDCGKSLKNLYLHLYLYFSYFSFIIFKMLFFIFGHCPKNCLIARKKIILPDSGGCSPPQLIRLCRGSNSGRKCTVGQGVWIFLHSRVGWTVVSRRRWRRQVISVTVVSTLVSLVPIMTIHGDSRKRRP